MDQATLRIHHIEPDSLVNGPGRRFVVWVQGCTLGCPGCFNPETFPREGGQDMAVSALAGQILANCESIEGVTISGGEPLQQIQALNNLVRAIKEQSRLSVLLFSGFTWEEIQRIPGSKELIGNIDVLLAGRYRADNRIARGLLSSTNKTIHFLSGRYSMQDLAAIPEAEVIIGRDGSLTATGIDPFRK